MTSPHRPMSRLAATTPLNPAFVASLVRTGSSSPSHDINHVHRRGGVEAVVRVAGGRHALSDELVKIAEQLTGT